MPTKRWTPDEDRTLRNCLRYDVPHATIAAKLGRTVGACRCRAKALGIADPARRGRASVRDMRGKPKPAASIEKQRATQRAKFADPAYRDAMLETMRAGRAHIKTGPGAKSPVPIPTERVAEYVTLTTTKQFKQADALRIMGLVPCDSKTRSSTRTRTGSISLHPS